MYGVARKKENLDELSKKGESILKNARVQIAELEKKSLPEKIVGFEDINSAVRIAGKTLLELANEKGTNSINKIEFSELSKQNALLIIELDKRIMEGLNQLKGDEIVHYMRMTAMREKERPFYLPPEDFGKIYESWMKLSNDGIQKIAEDFIPGVKGWLKKDIEDFGKIVKLIDTGESLLVLDQKEKLNKAVRGSQEDIGKSPREDFKRMKWN
jgi:hypothetical protein